MNVSQWINLLASVTLIEMMLTIGLGTRLIDLAAVAKDWRLILRAVLANYILVPAAAVGLLLLFKAAPMVAAGFLIVAVCPGAPYAAPFTALAKGNVATATGLMVILAGSSAIAAPILLRVLLPMIAGDQGAQINAAKMVSTLALTQFLPLCVGLFVSQKNPAMAAKLKTLASRLCTLLNIVLLSVILAVQFRMLVEIRIVGYFGMLALVIASLAAGWLFGSSRDARRKTLALTTAVRNVGVALVIASGSFAGTAAVTATTAFALFQTVVIALVAMAWGRFTIAPAGLPKAAAA